MAALVVVAALAGCSKSDSVLDEATTSVPAERSTSTSTASTTTSASTTTTTRAQESSPTSPAAPRCPSPAVVVGPSQSGTSADVDRDGRSDQILVWRDDSGTDHVTISFADGGAVSAPIFTDSPSSGPQSFGAADVDGVGAPEIFVGVGSGASATLVGLFVFDACELTRVTTGGEPTVIAVGGSVGSIAGATCEAVADGPGLVVRTGTSQDGDSYTGEARSFVLDGSVLRLVDASDASTSRDQPGFDRFTSLRCGQVAVG